MKSLDHPDYRIPGTNWASLSKWSRENIPKPPHGIPLGSVVEIDCDLDESYLHFIEQDGKTITLGIQGKARLIVVAHHHDCDGTALYEIAAKPIAPPEGRHMGQLIQWDAQVGLRFHGIGEEALRPTGDSVPLELFVPWFS